MVPGEAGSTPPDVQAQALQTMGRLTLGGFGKEALGWAEGRLAPVMDGGMRSVTWGAKLGAGFDRDGIVESAISCEWGPGLMDALPAPLYRIARIATDTLPGLRPSVSTIRCGRSSGTQQITFEVTTALPLAGLKPLMDGLQLGHQHAGLMSACAFVLGARFTLPPGTSTITLRPTRSGVELRLDVDLDALPDVPPQLASLLRLQMAERPNSLRGLDRWLTALTPDGYPGPGDFTTLSIWVRPDMPARVALYLRPSALASPPDAVPVGNGTYPANGAIGANGTNGAPARPAPVSAAPSPPATASSYWG
jgi:hypothetical protein